MVKEIFFHYSEFKGDLEALQAGDDVEFTIKDRNVNVKLFQLSTIVTQWLPTLICHKMPVCTGSFFRARK